MKIAVLGWGSLLWDPKTLEIDGAFAPGGPSLPIEFCRISANQRLTLVIDENFGTLCDTYVATSAFAELPEAIDNLRIREGMNRAEDVGFVDLRTGARSERAMERHGHVVETIADWTAAAGYDAAIWTALESGFESQAREPFSVNAAVRFLETLEQHDAEAFARALEYIRRAPEATKTPLRDRVAEQWLAQGFPVPPVAP
jgi:hypothetical protein